tara:strand:- start:107 stop:949 length:843 start_codon:yes stop_codon:yes gene_type:complete
VIIWLASYPKSGNTLVRAILSSYLFTDDGNFKFELLNYIKQFPDNFLFEKLGVDIDNKFEVEKNYVEAQKLVNLYSPHSFLKTHSPYKLNYHYKFTDFENTLGAIYIVRDPRNVVTSFANHFEMTLEESLEKMLSASFYTGVKFKTETSTFVGSWSSNYNSWKSEELKDKCLLIRYEDLLDKKKETIIKILKFIARLSKIELKLNEKKLENTLKTTDFNYLRKLENEQGFHESVTHSKNKTKIKFFKLGPKNEWQNLLKDSIKKKIEDSFKQEMMELGYL